VPKSIADAPVKAGARDRHDRPAGGRARVRVDGGHDRPIAERVRSHLWKLAPPPVVTTTLTTPVPGGEVAMIWVSEMEVKLPEGGGLVAAGVRAVVPKLTGRRPGEVGAGDRDERAARRRTM